MRDRFAGLSLAIFVLALTLRAVHLAEARQAVVFDLRMGDASLYDAWSAEIARGDWIGRDVFYQAPLYPYWLAAIRAFAPGDLAAVRIAQILLGALACVLVAWAGRRLLGERTGLYAGTLLAVYPPALFYDVLLEKATLSAFLVAWLLAALGRTCARPGLAGGATCGAVLGALCLVRENALLWIPLVLVWMLWEPSDRTARRRAAAACALALALVLAPVALRNRLAGGEWHLITANLGPNLYIGNHASANGSYVALRWARGSPEFEQKDATDLATEALGHAAGPGEVSRFWAGRALRWIASAPGEWLRLMGRKLLLVGNATELADTEDAYTYGDASVLLGRGLRVFDFGTLLALAGFGVAAGGILRRRIWILAALPLAWAAALAVFFVLGRYRHPMVPALALLAGHGLVRALSLLRSARRGRFAFALATGLALWLVSRVEIVPQATLRATTLYNVGTELARDPARLDEAIASYRAALALAPDRPATLYNLANALARAGRHDEAVEHYRRALDGMPDLAEAWINLGTSLAAGNRLAEARQALERAVGLAPEDARAQADLGLVLGRLGQLEAARAHFREALRLDPSAAETHYNLGNLLATAGARTEAEASYRHAIALAPDRASFWNNLGVLLARDTRWEEAVAAYRQALEHRPAYAEALVNLAVALGARGDAAGAIEHYERALALVPDLPVAQNNLAWMLATTPRGELRDPLRAVQLAEDATQGAGARDPVVLATLAAAYAAAGRFAEALGASKQAEARARERGQSDLVESIRARERRYASGEAWREPAAPRHR